MRGFLSIRYKKEASLRETSWRASCFGFINKPAIERTIMKSGFMQLGIRANKKMEV